VFSPRLLFHILTRKSPRKSELISFFTKKEFLKISFDSSLFNQGKPDKIKNQPIRQNRVDFFLRKIHENILYSCNMNIECSIIIINHDQTDFKHNPSEGLQAISHCDRDRAQTVRKNHARPGGIQALPVCSSRNFWGDELFHRAERGTVFESFAVSEMYKNFLHQSEQPSLYFWRDSSGHEVDIIIDLGKRLIPMETKSAQTIASDLFVQYPSQSLDTVSSTMQWIINHLF